MRIIGKLLLAGALALGGIGGVAYADHAKEGEKLTLTDLPPAVRATFQKEAQGGKIEELRSATRDGKTIYEGEIVSQGKGVDLQVGKDGKVVKRSAPHEEAGEHAPEK
jgi:multidrug efflux pump subunit AcrA (membrane-fusion protein)